MPRTSTNASRRWSKGSRPSSTVCPEKPVAISFAFPGPADYPNGIIGGYLPNFPSFREGVALGPFLEAKFGIPVYINNDGDLFAYGEALGGALPEVNARLEALGSPEEIQKPRRLHLRHGTRRGPCDRQPAEPRRQLMRRDVLPASQENARNHRRGRGVDPCRETRLRRSFGRREPTFEPKDICEIAEGKRREMSRPRRRLLPKWARSPATPWLRP